MKTLSANAYQALREALAVIFWNKKPFESFLRTVLRDSPRLLAGLSFSESKREVADALVDRLIQDEGRYQAVVIDLMLEVAGMEDFPNVAAIKDQADRTLRLAEEIGRAHV